MAATAVISSTVKVVVGAGVSVGGGVEVAEAATTRVGELEAVAVGGAACCVSVALTASWVATACSLPWVMSAATWLFWATIWVLVALTTANCVCRWEAARGPSSTA